MSSKENSDDDRNCWQIVDLWLAEIIGLLESLTMFSRVAMFNKFFCTKKQYLEHSVTLERIQNELQFDCNLGSEAAEFCVCNIFDQSEIKFDFLG